MFMGLLHHLMLRFKILGRGIQNAVETSLDDEARSGRPLAKKCVRKFGICYTLIGEFRWKK